MKKNWLIISFVLILIILIFIGIYLNVKEENNRYKDENIKFNTTQTQKEVNLMDGITINYHSSIRIEKGNKIIYFDPYKIEESKNDADFVFVTHSHYDHYSTADIKKVINDNTMFIVTKDLLSKVKTLGVKEENITIVTPEENYNVNGLSFDTIPAYNLNKTFHPKSNLWVGYNVLIDGYKYYVVGDSDVTGELKNVKCDVIFIPVGGTYTMTDMEAVSAVNEMNVKYAIPIHYGEVGSRSNAEVFVNNLKETKGIILK